MALTAVAVSTASPRSSIYSRDRSGTQDRHHLPNPKDSVTSLRHWENGLLKERVADLYTTLRGLSGHVRQIQQELNRVGLDKLDGLDGKHVKRIKQSVNTILEAVEKAKASAKFELPGNLNLGLAYTKWVMI